MTQSRPISVCAWPAFSNKALNPYNHLLYSHMDPAQVTVKEYRLRHMVPPPADIFHIHWPDFVLTSRGSFFWTMLPTYIAGLPYRHTRPSKLVWTVHNLTAHDDAASSPLRKALWRRIITRVDATIHLSHSARDQALTTYPFLAERPHFVIPHGHYRSSYDLGTDKTEARRSLGWPEDGLILLHAGQIRGYKNVSRLMQYFSGIDDADLRLVIAGGVKAGERGLNGGALDQEIQDLAALDNRIITQLKFIPDDQLAIMLRAADMCVFPYTRILNSGSLLLSLSADRPALVPHQGSMVELHRDVGPRWVRTYDGEFAPEHLTQAITALRSGELANAAPQADEQAPLQAYDWNTLSARTVEAYRQVLDQS